MLFPRTLVLSAALALPLISAAQRVMATCLQDGLFRVDLGDMKLFADVAPTGPVEGLDAAAVVLCPNGRKEHLPAAMMFGPERTGAAADSLSSTVGDRTGVYVFARTSNTSTGPRDSFLVQWNGRRFFFSGDKDDPTDLLATSDVDVAFITPAIALALGKQQRKVDAKKVVLYHTGGSVPDDLSVPCDRCEVISPAPGEALLLLR